MAASVKETRYK